jgi:hypothetical protein
MRPLAFLAIGGFIIWMIFGSARERAESSSDARMRLVVGSVIGLALGAVMAFVLPHRVTRSMTESPAGVVVTLVLWIVGGGLILTSVTALAGALSVPPRPS